MSKYRRFKPEDARVLLFDGGSAPLATFGDKRNTTGRAGSPYVTTSPSRVIA